MIVAHKLIALPSASIAASRMLAAFNESIKVFQIVISSSKFVVVCTPLGSRSVFRCTMVILKKTLFPKGIHYDAEKHQYLTSNCNQYLLLVASISGSYEGNKKATFQDFPEKSPPVPG